MSSFLRSVPLLELLPGQGMGITELALSSYTYGVIYHAHGAPTITNELESLTKDLSQQTTFVMRFFNFYLKKAIALVICLIFLPIAVSKRNKKISEGIK